MAISKQEHLERKEKVLKEALQLFAENSIEAVSMQQIADAAGIGVASVFRYYANKTELVIAVSAYAWGEYLKNIQTDRPLDFVNNIPAIDRLRFTLDTYMDLYKNHKDLLRYTDNFNHYIVHENVKPEQLEMYRASINPISERLHMLYEKGKEDKTIRTDIPEKEFIRTISHSMMAACHHYASGFLWGADSSTDYDYSTELSLLKEMILKYACEGIGA